HYRHLSYLPGCSVKIEQPRKFKYNYKLMSDKENIIRFKVPGIEEIPVNDGDYYYKQLKDWYYGVIDFLKSNNFDELKIDDEGTKIKDFLDNKLIEIDNEIFDLKGFLSFTNELKTNIQNYIVATNNKGVVFEQIDSLINLLPKYIKSIDTFQQDFIKVQGIIDGIKEEMDIQTGHLSQKGLNKALKRSFDLVRKAGKGTVAVMYFDGNDLKTVNDTYGQEFGQEYIYEMGRVIEKVINQHSQANKFYYRMSNVKHGDERVVLLTDISKATLHAIVRNIFRYLKKNKIKVFDKDIRMSLCAGISYIKAYDTTIDSTSPVEDCLGGFTHRNLYYLANTGLMKAKRKKGKNGIFNRYVFSNIRDVGNIEDYKMVKSLLPKTPSKNSLLKKTISQLRVLRKKNSSQLTFARNLEEKEILNKNIALIAEVIQNKISSEIELDFHSLEVSINEYVSNLQHIRNKEQFENNKTILISEINNQLNLKKQKYLNIFGTPS
ncbi:MAG: diguanylate cyclase, partial [Candidatus Absconditabacteria bacterium]